MKLYKKLRELENTLKGDEKDAMKVRKVEDQVIGMISKIYAKLLVKNPGAIRLKLKQCGKARNELGNEIEKSEQILKLLFSKEWKTHSTPSSSIFLPPWKRLLWSRQRRKSLQKLYHSEVQEEKMRDEEELPGKEDISKEKLSIVTESIRELLQEVFRSSQCELECLIISLIYVLRIWDVSPNTFNLQTYELCIICSVLLSSKMYDDFAMLNSSYLYFTSFTQEEINRCESDVLQNLSFNLFVKEDTFLSCCAMLSAG